MSLRHLSYQILILLVVVSLGCSKTTDIIPDNEPGSNFNISDLKIESYINRIFIDIIGREPTDEELTEAVDSLKATDLSKEERIKIVQKLMTDTAYSVNEGSYREAYALNLYNLAKIRCLENQPDGELTLMRGITKAQTKKDSILGNWERYYRGLGEIYRIDKVLGSQQDLEEGIISYRQMYATMIDNPLYDVINMNTFNYVRATFDQMLWRLPTEQEYNASFDMIEHDLTRHLFGRYGTSKKAYIDILTNSWGMYEGMVIWAFQAYMKRQPTSGELYTLLIDYLKTDDINQVITEILLTDEYANFQ